MAGSRGRPLEFVRMRDAMLAAGTLLTRPQLPSAAPVVSGPIPFTDSDWQFERSVREWVDTIALQMRWKVRIKLDGDTRPREFYFVGQHSDVLRRARVLFSKFESLTAEPAGIAGDEIVDTRLNSLSLAKGF